MGASPPFLRALGGAPLKGNALMRLVYVDEAGISKDEPFLVVSAVVVHADHQLIPLERYLDKLVARWIPADKREGFIFHATELFNGGGKVFRRDDPDWPLDKRLKIADDIAAIPKRFRLPLMAAWTTKATFPQSDSARAIWDTLDESKRAVVAHVTSFMACSVKVDHWMREQASNEVCMMIVEDNNEARALIWGDPGSRAG